MPRLTTLSLLWLLGSQLSCSSPSRKIDSEVCIYNPKDLSFICADSQGKEVPVRDENYIAFPGSKLPELLQ